jgi:hypothetical protein
VWRTPVRLVLNLATLANAHFKATLRTAGYLAEVLPIACSQVRLTGVPLGRPGRFQVPLQNARDFSVCAGMLCVTASISEVALAPPAAPVWVSRTEVPQASQRSKGWQNHEPDAASARPW